RDQREAHRKDGEADLARAEQRGLAARHAGLDMTSDVFQNDDRIVDDKAGRDRQRHQRQVIEAVPQQVHRPESPNQRYRYGDARISVARPLRRKRNTTRITRAIAMNKVISTSRRGTRNVREPANPTARTESLGT